MVHFMKSKKQADIRLSISININQSRGNEDRADWIANDESLYLWAKSEGVKV